MKLYEGLQSFNKLPNAIVTSGTFDGVHIGHQQILDQIKSIAATHNGETVLLTYWPHPRIVLNPDYDLKLLSTFNEKAQILEKHGLDHLIKIHFTHEFSKTTSSDFIENILVNQIGTKKLVIGYDHKFGRNREGSFEHLVKHGPSYGFDVEEIPAQEIEEITVSSTKIRNSLIEGELHIANKYLGRPYAVHANVVHGEKVGRSLGFPTANLAVDSPYKLIPKDGTYAVKVEYDSQTYGGMLNIGFRPTRNGKIKSIETHIFDFNQSIYGETIKIEFLKLIRNEQKFDSLDSLKNQLHKDKVSAIEIINEFEK